MAMLPGGPPLEEMQPRCEVCQEENVVVRQMLALSGQKTLKVPAATWRSPFMCANCRGRLIDLLRKVIALEQAEALPPVPEGMTPS